jgi:hypothetical protein
MANDCEGHRSARGLRYPCGINQFYRYIGTVYFSAETPNRYWMPPGSPALGGLQTEQKIPCDEKSAFYKNIFKSLSLKTQSEDTIYIRIPPFEVCLLSQGRLRQLGTRPSPYV